MKGYAGKPRKKLILITGGAGFIGSHLCELLLKRGNKVICVDNFITGTKENIAHLMSNPDFSLIEHNVSEVLPSFLPLTSICHLASPASPVDYQNFPIDTLLVNSLGTYQMLNLAKEHSARFLLASTSEVYGTPLEHPQKESYWGNVNPIGPRSCYNESKRFAEALAMAFQRRYGLTVSISRIFNTYGPRMRRDDGRVIPSFITKALQGKPLTIYGDGKQTRSFCYISDLVEGLFRMIDSEPVDPINLGSSHEHTILELAQIIKRIVGSDSDLIFTQLPEDDPNRRRPDLSRAREVLGWEPKVSLEQGLRETVDYFERS